MNTPSLYLASQSPRRAELLAQIGVSFRLLLLRDDPRGLAEVDETSTQGEEPLAYVQRICAAKADAAWESASYRQLTPLPVLAADTTVVADGKIVGKPQDRADAARILRLLSGRQHLVLSAVSLRLHERTEMRVSDTAVTFAVLSDERIRHYLASGEADDKAGAYGIQGLAGAFVQRIEGSYSGVVGLPLCETAELLQLFGLNIP